MRKNITTRRKPAPTSAQIIPFPSKDSTIPDKIIPAATRPKEITGYSYLPLWMLRNPDTSCLVNSICDREEFGIRAGDQLVVDASAPTVVGDLVLVDKGESYHTESLRPDVKPFGRVMYIIRALPPTSELKGGTRQ